MFLRCFRHSNKKPNYCTLYYFLVFSYVLYVSYSYKGTNCEENINECEEKPCLNSGTCFDTYGSYSCECLSGFTGQNCEIVSTTWSTIICYGHSFFLSFKIKQVCDTIMRLRCSYLNNCSYLLLLVLVVLVVMVSLISRAGLFFRKFKIMLFIFYQL